MYRFSELRYRQKAARMDHYSNNVAVGLFPASFNYAVI